MTVTKATFLDYFQVEVGELSGTHDWNTLKSEMGSFIDILTSDLPSCLNIANKLLASCNELCDMTPVYMFS